MIVIMTLPFAGIVGFAAYLQAHDGGIKFFLASMGLGAVALAASMFLGEEWAENDAMLYLLGGMMAMSGLLIAGVTVGAIGKRFWSAGKTGGAAFFLAIALLWIWTWTGILT